jgi:membrane-associated protease RseP (regulator of RpoE activity)
MPPLIRIANPIRLHKLTKIMEIGGVDTYVHWSVFVAIAFILAGVASRPALTILGLTCYLGIFLIHETGHALVARRRGCGVVSIEIYPIFGITKFERPWSQLDHSLIAWGGVVAQAVFFVPLLAWASLFGYSKADWFNMIIAILGFYSLAVAIFNLVPIRPLDGATAWRLFPELLAARRRKINRKPMYR